MQIFKNAFTMFDCFTNPYGQLCYHAFVPHGCVTVLSCVTGCLVIQQGI